MSQNTTEPAAGVASATESPWVDSPDYPHRIENHVKVYLHLEETGTGARWVVSPVTVDGYPLDGVEDGHYCDYEGHPPGARPDWDRQHREAAEVHLPTAEELLPLLATALGSLIESPSAEQRRAAADLLAEHAEWRATRADLSAGEAAGAFPDPSDWHDSDDAGCDLADRAIALLAELTGHPSPTGPTAPDGSESPPATLQRSMLQPPAAFGTPSPRPGSVSPASPTTARPSR
jgi:hypothetical protein